MSISKQKVKIFCKEFENIENYQEAVSSPEQWDCHHRLEETGLSVKDLINSGMYYNRPACELIFLTHEAHTSLHKKGKVASYDTKKKMSDSRKGKIHSIETRKKISDAHVGKVVSDETKKKISKNHADYSGSKHPGYKFICPIKLTYMYCKQEMSANMVAKELGVHRTTILNKLRELNIPIRKR